MKRKRANGLMMLVFIALVFGSSGLNADNTITPGIELFESRQYGQAQNVFKQLVSANETDAAAQYYLGRTYFVLCGYSQAINHLERAVELENKQPDYYFWLGRAYGEKAQRAGVFKQAGLAKKIRKAFEQAVALNPKYVEARIGLGNFYAQAPRFMGGGIDKATEQAAALADLDVLKSELLRARILEEEKEPDRAEASYKVLEQRYGFSSSAFDLYGDYGKFLLRRGRFDEAIDILRKQTALRPENLSALFNLAAAYKAAGRSQDAAAEYAKAAKINPKCTPPKKQYAKEE
ncbi:MAG: tetratricopeptide repeat protein [Acidiferrobacterales bacterium]